MKQSEGAPSEQDPANEVALAARHGKSQRLRELLRAGADPNRPSTAGLAPLAAAVSRDSQRDNRWGCAQMLLEAGADTEAKGPGGSTALMIAIDAGAIDCVKLLIESGARVDARDDDGRAPARLAAQNGRLDALLELAKAGASLDDDLPLLLRDWLRGESLARFMALLDQAALRSDKAAGRKTGGVRL